MKKIFLAIFILLFLFIIWQSIKDDVVTVRVSFKREGYPVNFHKNIKMFRGITRRVKLPPRFRTTQRVDLTDPEDPIYFFLEDSKLKILWKKNFTSCNDYTIYQYFTPPKACNLKVE